MKFKRSSGVLLHPTSLPGRFGVGDLGAEAYRFVDWLAAAGQRFWQIMPLGPTGYGDSPYSSLSAFAGNTSLVSPEELVKDGLLSESDLSGAEDFPAGRVDYGKVIEYKRGLLEKAFGNFTRRLKEDEGLRRDSWAMGRPEEVDFTGRDAGYRYLRAKGNSIEGGTSEVLRNIIAERVLGLPAEPRVDTRAAWKDLPR